MTPEDAAEQQRFAEIQRRREERTREMEREVERVRAYIATGVPQGRADRAGDAASSGR